MPVYQFDCYGCGVRSDTLRAIRERDAAFVCPDCGSKATERVVAAPVVQTPLDGNYRGSGKKDLDRVIGADAAKRHAAYDIERDKRNKVREACGQRAVGRRADGSYAPMNREQLETRQKGFNTFDYAVRNGKKVIL